MSPVTLCSMTPDRGDQRESVGSGLVMYVVLRKLLGGGGGTQVGCGGA